MKRFDNLIFWWYIYFEVLFFHFFKLSSDSSFVISVMSSCEINCFSSVLLRFFRTGLAKFLFFYYFRGIDVRVAVNKTKKKLKNAVLHTYLLVLPVVRYLSNITCVEDI